MPTPNFRCPPGCLADDQGNRRQHWRFPTSEPQLIQHLKRVPATTKHLALEERSNITLLSRQNIEKSAWFGPIVVQWAGVECESL